MKRHYLLKTKAPEANLSIILSGVPSIQPDQFFQPHQFFVLILNTIQPDQWCSKGHAQPLDEHQQVRTLILLWSGSGQRNEIEVGKIKIQGVPATDLREPGGARQDEDTASPRWQRGLRSFISCTISLLFSCFCFLDSQMLLFKRSWRWTVWSTSWVSPRKPSRARSRFLSYLLKTVVKECFQ